jgi:Ca2+-binding EF-hand superfamily protein
VEWVHLSPASARIFKKWGVGALKSPLIAAAAVLLSAGASAATYQPGPQQGAREGVQTRVQAVERVRSLFARVDANRDGAITPEERQAARAQLQASRGQRGAQLFERLDANRDNVISREEWARAQGVRADRQAARGERGQGVARRDRGLLRADLNRDQKITLEEAESAALQRFDWADLNRDGQVTRAERQQRQQQRGQARN